MTDVSAAKATVGAAVAATAERITRHALIDRLGHWVMAACVLALLATGFLPILGIQFAWVAIHWSVGLVLTVVVTLHTFCSLAPKSIRSMLIGVADLRDVASIARWSFRLSNRPPYKPGKYSPAQKIIHHAFAVTVLTTIITGLLMMRKIDTPIWERDAGIFTNATWGLIHVLHGVAALLLITMVISHVYFALRPEKLLFLRSMCVGWITREEYESHHDARRWRVDE